jgi:hypothetical protein
LLARNHPTVKRFRQEEPGSFSDRHRAHIHVYASQDEELRHKLKDYEIYGYMPQVSQSVSQSVSQ